MKFEIRNVFVFVDWLFKEFLEVVGFGRRKGEWFRRINLVKSINGMKTLFLFFLLDEDFLFVVFRKQPLSRRDAISRPSRWPNYLGGCWIWFRLYENKELDWCCLGLFLIVGVLVRIVWILMWYQGVAIFEMRKNWLQKRVFAPADEGKGFMVYTW